MLIVRTQKPFYQSKPGRALLIVTGVVTVVTLALPYLPLHTLFGLRPFQENN